MRILPLDLMKEESFERLKMVLAKEQPVVRILVNASGYGISGPFEHQTEEDAAGMIHLNCEALTRITYLVLPYLRRGSFYFIRWHLLRDLLRSRISQFMQQPKHM